MRAFVIWRRRAMVLGASGSDRKRRRSARPTATYAAGTQGNWCASLRPKSSTCSHTMRTLLANAAGLHATVCPGARSAAAHVSSSAMGSNRHHGRTHYTAAETFLPRQPSDSRLQHHRVPRRRVCAASRTPCGRQGARWRPAPTLALAPAGRPPPPHWPPSAHALEC